MGLVKPEEQLVGFIAERVDEASHRFAVRAAGGDPKSGSKYPHKPCGVQVACVGEVEHPVTAAVDARAKLPAQHGLSRAGLSGEQQIAVLVVAKGAPKGFEAMGEVAEVKGLVHV